MGDVGNKSNLFYFGPYLLTHLKVFFTSYEGVKSAVDSCSVFWHPS